MSNFAIETTSLTRRYWTRTVVRDLTLQVPVGSVCALLGSNGAGKSTTLKMLAGLLPPTKGRARVLGADCTKLQPRDLAQLGYVSEDQKLPGWMTLEQLINYCRPLYPKWDDAFAQKLEQEFDLPRGQKIRTFSRGMKMKAALLVSLAPKPSVLLLDEPFSGLDPLVREELISGLLAWSEQEKWSVLITSHDLDEVERLADHLAMLNDGKLDLHESVDSLQTRFRSVRGTAAGDPRPPSDTWWEWRCEGGRFEFTDSNFTNEADLTTKLNAIFPQGITSLDATPLNLRGIYLALARQQRTARKEARK
jgi:ABC-2 type transport system ATP-binding protein